MTALNSITGARVDWSDSKGLNQWEHLALELAEERSQLGYTLLLESGGAAFKALTLD